MIHRKREGEPAHQGFNWDVMRNDKVGWSLLLLLKMGRKNYYFRYRQRMSNIRNITIDDES